VEEIITCKNCGAPPEEGGYPLELCPACRNQFANRPLPVWLTGASVLVAAVVLFAMVRFPTALGAGIAFERGRRAEAAGNYTAATIEYRRVAERYPDSESALVRLGVSEYRAGNLPQAVLVLNRLSGRSGDEDSVREVNQVMDEIEQRLGKRGHRRR
jgi:Flp pilus assembly protein TadD